MFENRNARLLPRPEFYRRLLWSALAGLALVSFSLGVGLAGYHWICGLPWIDSFLDASMILSGMGPVSPLTTSAGKLFAGCYAIYCGVALIGTTGIIFAPVIHRALHKFHLEDAARD